MKDFIIEINSKTHIKISEKDIEKVLAGIKTTSNFWMIISLSRNPFNVAVEIIKKLNEEKYIHFEKEKVLLAKRGEEFCKKNNIFSFENLTCQSCSGRGVSINKLIVLEKEFKETVKDRPEAIIDYDQGFVSPKTSIARIALLASRGDIKGKNILILGDDDLVSIAAGLSGFPKKVTVLEVDERLVKYINEKSEKLGLPVEAIQHDLKYKLPEKMEKRYDTFLTDPPETVEGLDIFIGRGIAGLKGPGCAGYFGLTYIESSLRKWNEFQKMLAEKYKVVITDIIHDFNLYENWDYLLESIRGDLPGLKTMPDGYWYRSSMYRIETLEYKDAENKDKPEEPLYVDFESLVWTKKE
ncbi:MAG: bis-aminopropyl spermidine synthase family protein, partial [Actinomycetia bacterium]|nr:bis-aminopropyl spermidine synthase family protein [Actinomycetes bacterium]